MYIYICMYIYMYIYKYMYMYTNIHKYIHMYEHMRGGGGASLCVFCTSKASKVRTCGGGADSDGPLQRPSLGCH